MEVAGGDVSLRTRAGVGLQEWSFSQMLPGSGSGCGGGAHQALKQKLKTTLELARISETCQARKLYEYHVCFDHFTRVLYFFFFCQERVILTIFLRKHYSLINLFLFKISFFILVLRQRLLVLQR